MRVKSHQVFYEQPIYQGRGRPPKVGKRFKLSQPSKQPDLVKTINYKDKPLRITSYSGLQAKKAMDTPLKLVKLEFLNEQQEALYDKPIWLVSTATELDAEVIAKAYLWRGAHELTFRFMKQHLALTKNQSPELKVCDNWFQLVALAMNLLLAIRDELILEPKPWYPQNEAKLLSQRQAQKQALSFFAKLPDLTKPPQPAGKGPGRAKGHSPPKRIRHPVIRKTPKRPKICPACPFKQAA